jgi:hypothetical protein
VSFAAIALCVASQPVFVVVVVVVVYFVINSVRKLLDALSYGVKSDYTAAVHISQISVGNTKLRYYS